MGGFFISNFCDNQLLLCTLLISCCLSSAKIQNFKAIHNKTMYLVGSYLLPLDGRLLIHFFSYLCKL